jgi:hypothetical protein
MKPKTLILIHPDHTTTLKNKSFVNQELELLLQTKNLKHFEIRAYNKNFKNILKKKVLKDIKKNKVHLIKNTLMINKNDLQNLKFLCLQCKNWGFLENQYFKFFKKYIKYPAVIRYIYLFFYTKVLSALIQNWVTQFDTLVTVCYYNRAILPFVLAFRNQNKKVWDIQHGSISNAHFAYNHNLFKLKSNLAPTGFYIYQKNAEHYLKKSLCEVVLLKSKKYPKNERKSTLLVTLQWACKVPKTVSDFLKKIKTKKVILRMHPRDHDPLYKKFKDPFFYNFLQRSNNIKIQYGSEPIENTLRSTYLHLTENCSIVHQAAERGILSFFWCSKFGPKMFQNEIKLGLARQLKSPEDLTKIIADHKL